MIVLDVKERKLLALALDPAAADGEIRSASEKLIRSFRARRIRIEDFSATAHVYRPKLVPGDTVLPFGKFRGRAIRFVPDWYLRWAASNVTTHPALVATIQNFLAEGGSGL